MTLTERQAEEPTGRWEDRCGAANEITYGLLRTCDRPREHKGLHTGRLWNTRGARIEVVGYVRW